MKPFRFVLEPLRVLRKQKERTAQQQYARMLLARDQAALRLAQASAELEVGWNLLRYEMSTGVAAGRLGNLQAWCKVLEHRRDERQSALAEASQAASRALEEMTGAIRDREALDRFSDKSRRAYERNVQREEQKQFDEMAVQRRELAGSLQLAGRKG